jgi:hypothetical protein
MIKNYDRTLSGEAYTVGWVLGLLGGIVEFLLLHQLIANFSRGSANTAFVLVMAKMLVMAGILVIVFLFWRNQVVVAGSVMAGTLILLAVGSWFLQRCVKKEGKS